MLRFSKQKWSTATGHVAEALSWSAEVLGTDDHGTWLGSRRGNPMHMANGGVAPLQHDAVWLVTKDAWFLATFWFTEETDLTIDVCTPPVLDDKTCSFLDMELDLFRRPDGQSGVVDEDDWHLLVASGLISDDVVRTVEATAQTLLTLVTHQVEPFGEAALPWLRTLSQVGHPMPSATPDHTEVRAANGGSGLRS